MSSMSKRAQDQRRTARIVREQLARERRRKRTLWISIAVVAVLVIGGGIGYAVYSSQKPTTFNTPANANAAGDGIVTGSGPVPVEIYQDYLCPFCKQLHDSAEAQINQMAAQNKITLTIHPIAILDSRSTNKYSSRAAAAAGCASDGGKFLQYNDALYANQPAEGTAGPTNGELIATGRSIGLGDSFATCVNDNRYETWPTHTTDAASARGVSGTPTVFVNGTRVEPTLDAITAAVAAAGGPTPSAS
jgi:protein-disulfide isomerase